MTRETKELFRPVAAQEMELIQDSGFRVFPSRISLQPIFYPVFSEDYAVRIARDWNTRDEASGYGGYVTRFQVNSEYLARYEVKIVGGSQHAEYWIPAEELETFNQNIVGVIEVTREFHGNK